MPWRLYQMHFVTILIFSDGKFFLWCYRKEDIFWDISLETRLSLFPNVKYKKSHELVLRSWSLTLQKNFQVGDYYIILGLVLNLLNPSEKYRSHLLALYLRFITKNGVVKTINGSKNDATLLHHDLNCKKKNLTKQIAMHKKTMSKMPGKTCHFFGRFFSKILACLHKTLWLFTLFKKRFRGHVLCNTKILHSLKYCIQIFWKSAAILDQVTLISNANSSLFRSLLT